MLLTGFEFCFLFLAEGFLLDLVKLTLCNKEAQQQEEHEDEDDNVPLLVLVLRIAIVLGRIRIHGGT